MSHEIGRDVTLADLLPVPAKVKTAVRSAHGSLLAVARIRAVESPTPRWAFDPALSFIHSFRLLKPSLQNRRDPNMINAMGPLANLNLVIASCPVESLDELRERNIVFTWTNSTRFESSPGALVLRYMRAYHLKAEPTRQRPFVAIYNS